MPETPAESLPASLSSTTGGTSMEMGCPRAAASASMPPTPQPRTPRPLAVVVWESVPTRESKQATSPSASASVVTTLQKRSMLSWWQMPPPGGTISTFWKDLLAHLRKEKRSRLRRASVSWFDSTAPSTPATSAITEWSTTSVQGMCGLTFDGSPPRSTMASRMAAKSTKTGTPVKSWKRTRAGMNSISAPCSPARPASTTADASFTASSSVEARRTTFSRRATRARGRRSAPGMPDTSYTSRVTPPQESSRGSRAAATASRKALVMVM